MMLQDKATALKSGLLEANCGLFAQSALESNTANAAPPLPTVVSIDPGHCNVWAASRRSLTEHENWEPLTPISGGSYRHESGLRRFQQWMKRSLRRPAMKRAMKKLTEASLKTLDVDAFTAALVRQAWAWATLRRMYGGKAFAKRRFMLAKQKQRFEDKAVNRLIKQSEDGRDGPVVFAYGDAKFAFSMRGCHGGTPHARLRRRLAQKRRVVLIDEYFTTKRCPKCRCETQLSKAQRQNTKTQLYRSAFMIQPRGLADNKWRNGKQSVRGLSHCYKCHTLWSRDYAATLNIGRVFVELWKGGKRPAYLCRPPKCEAA